MTAPAGITMPTTSLAARIALVHSRGRLKDPLGHQVHTAVAMLYLGLLPVGTAASDIAFGMLAFWTAVRMPHIWRMYLTTWRVPVNWALFAWTAWEAASLLWSPDHRQGFDEFGAYRVIALPALLWPVLDRLPWLVGSLLCGVLVQNGAQLLQALGWLNSRPQEGEGRYGGLVHPIHTGAWCVAAMCWNLSAMLKACSTKIRATSLILFLCAAAGLIATESRGPWLAAALSLPLMLALIAVRRRELHKKAVLALGIGLLGSAAAWPVMHTRISSRIGDAIEEVRAAREQSVYWTSVGLRVGMSRWAWQMFTDHPMIGIGAGGYPKAQSENPDFQAALAHAPSNHKRQYMTKSHPHSLYLYTLACTGIIGGVCVAGVIVLSLRRAWVDPADHVFAEGTLFVLVSWLIGAASDTYNLNGQLLGMLAFIIAITLNYRPAIRRARAAIDPHEHRITSPKVSSIS